MGAETHFEATATRLEFGPGILLIPVVALVFWGARVSHSPRNRAGKPERKPSARPYAKTVTRRIPRWNSKRVTAASECVPGDNSFCSGVVFLAYLPAYKKVFRFRRASLSGWRSPGTSIFQSVPRWAQNSNARDRGRKKRSNLVPLFRTRIGERTQGNIGVRTVWVCKYWALSSVTLFRILESSQAG